MDNKTVEQALALAKVDAMTRRIDKSQVASAGLQPGGIWATDGTVGAYPALLREGHRIPGIDVSIRQAENGFLLTINQRTFVARDFKEAIEVVTAQAASAMLENT
jgi:hypothetical protein